MRLRNIRLRSRSHPEASDTIRARFSTAISQARVRSDATPHGAQDVLTIKVGSVDQSLVENLYAQNDFSSYLYPRTAGFAVGLQCVYVPHDYVCAIDLYGYKDGGVYGELFDVEIAARHGHILARVIPFRRRQAQDTDHGTDGQLHVGHELHQGALTRLTSPDGLRDIQPCSSTAISST